MTIYQWFDKSQAGKEKKRENFLPVYGGGSASRNEASQGADEAPDRHEALLRSMKHRRNGGMMRNSGMQKPMAWPETTSFPRTENGECGEYRARKTSRTRLCLTACRSCGHCELNRTYQTYRTYRKSAWTYVMARDLMLSSMALGPSFEKSGIFRKNFFHLFSGMLYYRKSRLSNRRRNCHGIGYRLLLFSELSHG